MESTDSDHEIRLKLYGETRADLLKRQLSNSENADRAILSVSTAALGFSLAFLKDIVPILTATHTWLLYSSWLLFVMAIVATLLSFFTSQKAIDAQLEFADRYYIQQDESAKDALTIFFRATDYLNNAASIIFVTGLFASCVFVGINLEKEQSVTDKQATSGGMATSPGQLEHKGAGIPSMQAVPVKPQGGAPVPGLQQVPRPPTTNPGSGSSGGK